MSLRGVSVLLAAMVCVSCGGRAVVSDGEPGTGTKQWRPGERYPRGSIAASAAGREAIYPPEVSEETVPLAVLDGEWSQDYYCDARAFDAAGALYLLCHGIDNVPSSDRILVFESGSSGDDPPIRMIHGPNTGFSGLLLGIAVDADGLVYVARDDCGDGTVLVFGPGADGDARPVRTIAGPDTELGCTAAVAIGPEGDLYVADAQGAPVLVFDRRAKGNAAPKRRIGTREDFTDAASVAFRSSGEMAVADVGDVPQFVIYGPNPRDGEPPIASIAARGDAWGVAFDLRGRLVLMERERAGTNTMRFVDSSTFETELVLTDVEGRGIAIAP